MRALIGLSGAIDAVTKKFGQLAEYLVLFCALISAGNATVRYLFNYSSNGWLEIQWYMFAGIVLLGASHTLRNNGHVRVDLIYTNISPRARLWVDLVGLIVFLLPFTGFIAWSCWPFFYQSWLEGEMSQNAGGLIRWPVKLILVVGFAMLFTQGISEIIKRIAALAGYITVDTTYEKPKQ